MFDVRPECGADLVVLRCVEAVAGCTEDELAGRSTVGDEPLQRALSLPDAPAHTTRHTQSQARSRQTTQGEDYLDEAILLGLSAP